MFFPDRFWGRSPVASCEHTKPKQASEFKKKDAGAVDPLSEKLKQSDPSPKKNVIQLYIQLKFWWFWGLEEAQEVE